ncbi:MAG: type VI secretion system baseplate subunit TssE [Pirellulaceae bacterium]
MNPTGKTTPLVPSILDRLIEPRGDEPSTELGIRGQSVGELQEAVRRDLQDLFNTRQSVSSEFSEEDELSRSLLTYGLPELSTLNPSVPDHRQQLQAIIERTIRKFEPRLDSVRVVSVAADRATGRGLRICVEALLRVSPSPVPVTFDTLIEKGSGRWQVVESGGA